MKKDSGNFEFRSGFVDISRLLLDSGSLDPALTLCRMCIHRVQRRFIVILPDHPAYLLQVDNFYSECQNSANTAANPNLDIQV